ncbi:Bacterial transcriptional activator domain protein [Caballeronia pedi]|uniref:Bacterial transcriptional activator domain protein n=1 Tax=Caballeronia pedi TaxID=1777141 RepID=A0A158CYZ6_9BURK|nr:BTAD domain-containing putative transcriptional regulator [Caballeronia pedi]SAK87598.1 Bacterial transcriptional activator domain protein [Caballeronia pedi]
MAEIATPATNLAPAFDACRKAVRAGNWNDGLAAWRDALGTGAVPSAQDTLYRVIARIRSESDPLAGIAELDPSMVTDNAARMDVRRIVVTPFVRDGALAPAAAALRVLVQAWPNLVDDRRLLASVLGRLKRWDEAIEQADAASRIDPHDTGLLASRIQLRLQASQVAEAARIARATLDTIEAGDANAHFWLTALIRNGDGALAARMASALDAAVLPNERAAAAAVQALLADKRIDAAIAAGEYALAAGHEGAALRAVIGQAYLARGHHDDRTVHALNHFARGVELAPKDLRLVSAYGEALLRAGQYAESIEPLKKACELAPEMEHMRAMLARAMRYAGRHGDAAEELLTLVRQQPERLRFQRAAVAALSQTGRKDEASTLYESYLQKRADVLPATFSEALRQLDQKIDSTPITQARLDWAWSMRRDTAHIDRAEWERAARWGYLVDYLLLEWLECRESQIEEAMSLLGNLDVAEAFFAPLLATGKGFVIATAHVGPMYAGLMTLELLGIPSRWLSTTPSVTRASYASALISTADQTEVQVAKECLRALQSGYAVCLAVEGAPNPSAPRVMFEGQEVTYSSFASRAAYRLGLPSLFYAPRWQKGEIVHTFEMLPNPELGEDVEAFALRWQAAYFGHLRDHIAGPPENLRLSGGIWRHVTSVDRSDAGKQAGAARAGSVRIEAQVRRHH